MGVGPVPILVRSTVSAGPWLSPASGSAGSRAHHTPLVRDVCHTEHFVLPRISESKIQNYTIIHRDFFRSCARVELGQASSLRAVQQQGPRPSQPVCGNAFFHRTSNAAGKSSRTTGQLSGPLDFPAALVVRWKNAFPHCINRPPT